MGGTLPPAPVIPPLEIVGSGGAGLAVRWNCTGGSPVRVAVTTTAPAVFPKVMPTPAAPVASVLVVAAVRVAAPDVTANVTGTPATGTEARKPTFTTRAFKVVPTVPVCWSPDVIARLAGESSVSFRMRLLLVSAT